jgi:hypothetical protein
MQADKNMGKVNNVPRKLEEFKNVLKTSSIPRDFTRNTLISKDNYLYYQDQAENTSRNSIGLKRPKNFASALEL